MHTVMERAAAEAQAMGSKGIEAEHLLLAVAREPEDTVRELLDSAGLDYQTITDALQREFEEGLGAAGISVTDRDVLRPRKSIRRPSDASESAKLVLERGMAAVDDKKDLRPAHILLGLLELKAGTVPRALALAGVDRDELRARTRAALPKADR
ncbi:hypothetical protein HUT06_17615 [Actinomadura sp. NAK00032]|nr:hypothetical protein HUT06_17615 [Actinomadura sp. NAK00032]